MAARHHRTARGGRRGGRLHLVRAGQARSRSRSSGRRCSASVLLRRHARIPPDKGLVRFLVLAPERTELVRYKLETSPVLRDAMEAGNWHVIRGPTCAAWLRPDAAGPRDVGAVSRSRPGRRPARRADGPVRSAGPATLGRHRGGPARIGRTPPPLRHPEAQPRDDSPRPPRPPKARRPPSTSWPTRSGSGSSSSARSARRSTATRATTTGCRIRARLAARRSGSSPRT